jgi:signal transduction histidine kinase
VTSIFFGLQAPVVVSLGTALGYFILIMLVIERRGWSDWPQRTMILYLSLSVLLSVGLSLTLWLGLRSDVPQVGERLAADLLTASAPLMVALTLMFVERPGAKWVALVGVLWLAFVVAVDFNLFGLQQTILGATPTPGTDPMRPMRAAGWAGFSAGTLMLVLVDFMQQRRPLHRNRILFWMLGLLFLLTGELFMWLDKAAFLIDVNQIGAVLRFCGVAVLTWAMISYHLPVLRRITRQVLGAVLTTLIVGGLIFIGILVVLGAAQQTLSLGVLAITIIVAIVLAAFIQPLRSLIGRLIDRLVYSGRYNPARALRDYGDAIKNIVDLNTLSTVAVGIIADALDVRRGSLMLVNHRENEPIDDVVIMEGMGALAVDVAEFSQASPIVKSLTEGSRPLTQYEIEFLPEYRAAPLPERYWLHSLEMEVYVPIRDKDTLVGMFAFGRKESGEPYSDQDLDVLLTVANQTTVVLQNARLVSDLRTANTSITQLNEDLTESNRRLGKLDKAKTDFIEIASHELRTPLTQVRGYSDILADMVQQGGFVAAHMNQISQGITRASVRLEQIISAMLDVSRIDAQALDIRTAAISVSAAVKMAVDNYKDAIRDRKMNVQVVELESLPPVQGDLQRLCQAFGNLVGNAIKFTPDGGNIVVSGRTLEDNSNGHPQRFVEIMFADTGIGIDIADQGLIFEKFYRVGAVELHSTGTTKFKGAGPGLGLPIAKGVVQAHGGKIWVESPGHDETRMPGSTFHIVLPVASPASGTGPLRAGTGPLRTKL